MKTFTILGTGWLGAKLAENLKSDYNVKVAICMALTKKTKEVCKEILNKENGNISKALRNIKS